MLTHSLGRVVTNALLRYFIQSSLLQSQKNAESEGGTDKLGRPRKSVVYIAYNPFVDVLPQCFLILCFPNPFGFVLSVH